MAYTPTEWETGDIITAEKLNNMEGGIDENDTAVIELDSNIGDLTALDTSAKNSLVAAVNEVKSGAIAKPASPSSGDFLVYNGTNWAAATIPEAAGEVF